MTTRHAVVGLILIAPIGCDQIDPVSGPDPTPPAVTRTAPPIAAGVRPLRLFDLPASFLHPAAAADFRSASIESGLNEPIPPEYQVFPKITDRFVAVGWGGTATLEGYAFMTFVANFAQQELELAIYRGGALLARQTWVEQGSSILPKSSGAFTIGRLNAGVSCGATGNGNSKHIAEIRYLAGQGWTTLARDDDTDSDVAEQAPCPPPPTCELKPQSSVTSSERPRARSIGELTASDFEQCSEPPPTSGGGESGSKGTVCYEVWLVYPGTGIEIYLGDVCYGDDET